MQNPWRDRPNGGLYAWLIVAALTGALLVTVLTYPTVPKMGSVGRFDNGDGRFSIWNVAWVSHALITDPRHVLDANIYYPHKGTLAYSELNLVAGVLGAPAYLITHNPLAATNSSIAAALWLCFMCMWALVRRLTGSPLAALVSATAYTFCPYLLSHTSHVQLLMAFVIPLNFLALHRLVERQTLWRGVQLGLAVAVGGLACGYYGIYGGIALGVGALWFSQRRTAYWRNLFIAVLTAGVLVAPVMIAFRHARADVGGGRTISDGDLRTYSAEPVDYIVSGAKAHELWRPDQFSGRDPLFPGVVVLLLAAAAILLTVRGIRGTTLPETVIGYQIIGAFAVVASFGPKALLYSVLFRVVPAMSLLRAPSRFGLVAMFAIAVLAGVAASSIRQRRWLAVALLLLIAAESGAETKQWGWPSWPIQETGAIPRAYRILATLPRGAVVEYPFPYDSTDLHRHTEAMLMSTYNWQPLVNGYSDVIPDDFYKILLPINEFPSTDSFAIMKNYNVRYVVWRIDTYNAESHARLEARFPPFMPYLKPIVQDKDVWLFEITGYPK